MQELTTVKALIDEQVQAFSDFKQMNDARLAQIEQQGKADPLLEEQVNKANSEIHRLQDKLGEVSQSSKIRMDELETLLQRPTVGNTSHNDEQQAKAFFSIVQNRHPDSISIDIEDYRRYPGALNAYLRKGDKAIAQDIQAALSVGSDPDGGYWVDPDTSGKLISFIYETSPMRQVADVQNIGTDALEGVNDLDEAGLGGWVGETQLRPGNTKTPTVGKWRIPVHEHYAEPHATQKVLDDAQFNVESWLARKVADKLARTENAAFIHGDGIGKPRGFLTYTSGKPSPDNWQHITQINTGANGAFANNDPGDTLIDLIFGLKAAYRNGAVWLMNRSTVGEVRKLKDGQGNYIWQPNFTAQQGGLLLGYPIVELEDMPNIANNNTAIAFGNFRLGYQIVDRQGIRVLRDPFTSKGFVKFYTTKRVGGDVVNFDAIRLLKFAA